MQFFESKLAIKKISCFKMTNFRALDILAVYCNISKIGVLIQITLCGNGRIQIDLPKTKYFSAEEVINYIPHTEKKRRYQYVKCLSRLGLCPTPCASFILETEDNSIQRQFYNSSVMYVSSACFVNTK